MRLCNDSGHIHFDLGIKDRPEFNYMVQCSDLGLVFYDSSDPNVAVIGLSSGKLHKFLSYGKPVVINDLPSMKSFLEDNGFGLASPPENLREAIRQVFAGYDGYVSRIRESYPAVIDCQTSYLAFVDSLECSVEHVQR
jgi:hypothetical protein